MRGAYLIFNSARSFPLAPPAPITSLLYCEYSSQSCRTGPNCRQSAWNQRLGHTALGGNHYVGPRTIQQCLDYCNATAACVGVDIDVNMVPLRCWIHVNADDLRSDNIYSQQGTDHYQLIERCPNARKGQISTLIIVFVVVGCAISVLKYPK